MPSTVGVNALDLYPCQKRNRSPVLAVRSQAFHGKGRAGAIGQNRKINNSYFNGRSCFHTTSVMLGHLGIWLHGFRMKVLRLTLFITASQ
jgi:hypothetical protein